MSEKFVAISEQDIFEAIEVWGEGIIKISHFFETEGIEKAREAASQMLDNLYGFEIGPVLFKPTLSGGSQTFRHTKEGALSYFVGQDPSYPLDTGFGLKFWRMFKSETSGIFISDNVAIWMGWVSFTDRNGAVTKVDKSWGYKFHKDGSLRIMHHHSSLPYIP